MIIDELRELGVKATPGPRERATVTRLHGCKLPEAQEDEDEPPRFAVGHWETCTCAEWTEAFNEHGGYDKLQVWSTLTDIDGLYGPPTIYTCWGERDSNPVVADGGTAEQWRQKPCAMDHVRYVIHGAPW